jgi:hypothetical protein
VSNENFNLLPIIQDYGAITYMLNEADILTMLGSHIEKFYKVINEGLKLVHNVEGPTLTMAL